MPLALPSLNLPVAFGASHLALVHRANLTSSQACPPFFTLRLCRLSMPLALPSLNLPVAFGASHLALVHRANLTS
ncbi:hypothetical protein Gotur_022658, partial [Gossypium turneri]